MLLNQGPNGIRGQTGVLASATFLSPAVGNLAFVVGPPGAVVPLQVLRLSGRFSGGTSCDLEVKIMRKTGATEIEMLPQPNVLNLTTPNTDFDTRTFEHPIIGRGDKLYVMVSAVTGSVDWIVFSIQYLPLES
jgi:hypothetical protein